LWEIVPMDVAIQFAVELLGHRRDLMVIPADTIRMALDRQYVVDEGSLQQGVYLSSTEARFVMSCVNTSGTKASGSHWVTWLFSKEQATLYVFDSLAEGEASPVVTQLATFLARHAYSPPLQHSPRVVYVIMGGQGDGSSCGPHAVATSVLLMSGASCHHLASMTDRLAKTVALGLLRWAYFNDYLFSEKDNPVGARYAAGLRIAVKSKMKVMWRQASGRLKEAQRARLLCPTRAAQVRVRTSVL
jgi:hypothetical protein